MDSAAPLEIMSVIYGCRSGRMPTRPKMPFPHTLDLADKVLVLRWNHMNAGAAAAGSNLERLAYTFIT
jgi:hypothetical protein